MKNIDEIFSLNVRKFGYCVVWCWNRNVNVENFIRLMEIVLYKFYGKGSW